MTPTARQPGPDPAVIGRRTLLQSAGLSLGALGLFAGSGCQSAVSQARELGSSSGGGPRRGGRLTAGLAQDVIPLNFFTNTSGITVIIGLAYESLIRYPNDRVLPTPRLAVRWRLAGDGRSISLWLRKGVTFHDGRPFTGADVESSIRTYALPEWNGQMRSTAAAVTGFEHHDQHTVTLRFRHRLANIFDLLDTVPIIDAGSLDRLGRGEAYIGTGPFRVVEWQPNTMIVFDRYQDYWQPDRPYLDGVDAKIMPDAKAALAALRSAQIDLSNAVSYLDLENLSARGPFRPIRLTGAEGQIYVGANVSAPPLDDIRVRRAIAHALDRERVVQDVLRGAGYPVNLPWPDYSVAYDAGRNRRYERDLATARALIADLGTLPAIPLTYGSPNPENAAVAAIVQSNLADIGIDVELDPIDQSQFTKQLIGAEFAGLWQANHSWAQYHPSTLTVSAYPFNAEHNASHYSDPTYSEDASAAWRQASSERAAHRTGAQPDPRFADLSEDLLRSLFLIEICVKFNQLAVSNRVQGVDYTKRSELLLTDAYLTA